MKSLLYRLKDIKIRKRAVIFVVISMTIATIGWCMFLVFFGRVDPIVRDTTSKGFQIYHYGLISLPFWLYAFLAPMLYIILGLYVANGNRILGIIAQIASVALSLILGAVLNMSSAVVHVIRNLDKNTITRDICITGLVGIIISILNLGAIAVAIPWFDRWSATKTFRKMVGDIEVTLGPDDLYSDDDWDEPFYANVHDYVYKDKDKRSRPPTSSRQKHSSSPRRSPRSNRPH